MPEQSFTQKKLGVTVQLTLKDDCVTRKVKDHSGEYQFDIDYRDIDFNAASIVGVNIARRFYRPAWLLLIISALTLSSPQCPAYLYWLAVTAAGAIGLFLIANQMGLLIVRYTLFPINGKPTVLKLKLIQDDQHDGIIQALRERQNERLREDQMAETNREDP